MWTHLSCGLALTVLCSAAFPAPLNLKLPAESEAQGASRALLEHAYGRLCAPPLGDIEFVLSDIGFQFTRRFTEYSGDVSGRMLGALTAAEQVLRREGGMSKELAARIPSYQQSDGHFGAPQNLQEQVNQARDMPILWGNGRILLAMAERCRQSDDPVLLEAAKRLGDYVLSTRPYYGLRENFERVGGKEASGFTTCYPSMIDGLVALAGVTGDPKYADEARFIARLSLIDQEFKGHHSHGRLITYLGMLDLDRLAETPEFTPAVMAGCRRVCDEMILPTGGVTEMSDRAYDRDEGCSEADWIRVNLFLWRDTGDTEYLDRAEFALRNHLLAMKFSNGGFGHGTFKALRQGDALWPGARIMNYVSDSYWCCSMHGTQLLADAATYAVTAESNNIYVNWLSEVSSVLDFDGRKVTVRTEQVSPVLWKVSLEGDAAGLILRLHLPAWTAQMSMNGAAQEASGGWVDIPLEGSEARTFTVEFPDGIRLAGPYAEPVQENAPARIFAGPDLYCLAEPLLDKGLLTDDAVPSIVLAADKPDPATRRIPVLVEGANGKFQHAVLEPVLGRTPGACRVLFAVRRVSPAEYDALAAAAVPAITDPGKRIEVLFSSDKSYEVYLNGEQIFGGGGWAEAPRVTAYARPGVNQIAVRTPAGIQVPGLIGLIITEGDALTTQPSDWLLFPCGESPSPALLTGAEKPEALPIKDFGGFGAEPWKHTPAHFASTPARWIWSESNAPQGGNNYLLFLREFSL